MARKRHILGEDCSTSLVLAPFNFDQLRLLIDASNQYDQWLACKRNMLRYKGWMSFRHKNGVDYLTSGRGNGLNQKSHGARSSETEAICREFNEGKASAKSQLLTIESRLAERAPLLKAVRLGRIHAPLAKLIREFDIQSALGTRLIVGGTHAIAAYEALAGQFFDNTLISTEDLDFIWKPGYTEEIAARGASISILKHLKEVDSSYSVNTERTFQVRNSKGLIVNFISDKEGANDAPKEYLRPIAIDGQEWGLRAPAVEVVVIDTTGLPVRLVVPDPRLYALHKAWLSKRQDRNDLKREKDMNQALAVSTLIATHLPQFRFDDTFLCGIPIQLQSVFAESIQPVIAKLTQAYVSKM